MTKTKMIVIEGTDGSGKGTQVSLLIEYLKKTHQLYSLYDFPQYHKTVFGEWISRYLKGDFGTVESTNPYLLMFPYAADRWQAKEFMDRDIAEGRIVIANRYATSAAYQAAKLPRKEWSRFIDWSFNMEYDGFGIPREDIVIFLYVPYDISQKLLDARVAKKYLGKRQKDIHEANEKLMRTVEKVYLAFSKRFTHWVRIDCTRNGEILAKDAIQELIIKTLKKRKIIT